MTKELTPKQTSEETPEVSLDFLCERDFDPALERNIVNGKSSALVGLPNNLYFMDSETGLRKYVGQSWGYLIDEEVNGHDHSNE